jgi:hypothetical protein
MKKIIISLALVFISIYTFAAKDLLLLTAAEISGEEASYAEISSPLKITTQKSMYHHIKNGEKKSSGVSMLASKKSNYIDISGPDFNEGISFSFIDYNNGFLNIYLTYSNTSEKEITFNIKKNINIYAVDKKGKETPLKIFTHEEILNAIEKGMIINIERYGGKEKLIEGLFPTSKILFPKQILKGYVFIDRKVSLKYKIIILRESDTYEFNFNTK